MATSKRKQTKRKGPGGARPGAGRPRSATRRAQVNFRVDEKMYAGLDAACERYKVGRTDLLRWMIDDVASGEWVPSHLRNLGSDGNKSGR